MTDRTAKLNNFILLLLFAAAAGAALVLASSLDQADLRRGVDVSLPLAILDPNAGAEAIGLVDLQDDFAALYRVFTRFILWVIVPILVVVYLLTPGNRRRKILFLLFFIAVVALVPMFVQLLVEDIDPNVFVPEVPVAPAIEPGVVVTPPAVSPEPAPPILGYLVSIIVIIAVSAVLGILYFRGNQQKTTASSIQQQTDKALTALKEGQPIEDVIVRLYVEMCEYINEVHGIQRKTSTTPREFQKNLGKFGIPTEASATLTRFFEAARYGGRKFDERSQAQAIDCLQTIKESAANFENT